MYIIRNVNYLALFCKNGEEKSFRYSINSFVNSEMFLIDRSLMIFHYWGVNTVIEKL